MNEVIQDVVRDAPRAPQAPIDPNVRVPDAVRRAAEAAENYYKAAPAPDAPAKTDVPQPGEPAAATPAEPAQPEPPPPSPTPEPSDDASYERKYKSQQGRIQSLNNELRDARNLTSQLGGEVMATQRALREMQMHLQQREQAPHRLLSPEEQSDFGEFIPVAKKAAREEFEPKLYTLEQEVQRLRYDNQQIKQGGIWASLDRAIPEWRSVNTSPEFKQWLNLQDPYSGYIRKALLEDAFQATDTARVVNIFRGFVAASAATRPATPSPSSAPTPSPASARTPAVSLDTLAAPGRARSAPGVNAADKPVYTSRDFTAFYDRKRKGLYSREEADAIERDMFAAQKDGRYQG